MNWSVLQISDCHLMKQGESLLGVDTQASLEAVLAAAMVQARPDAVVASGDLAHAATADVYRRFRATVRRHTTAPLLCLPGNHDVLGEMQAAGLPMAALTLGNWSIVPLDSHQDDEPAASIDETDRRALGRAMLASQAEHVLVVTHHPLIAINCPWLDKDRIQNGTEVLEWLSECSAVGGTSRLRGVVFGHAHQIVTDDSLGVPLRGAPSTCFQFLPESSSFSLDQTAPGFCWLELQDDGGWASRPVRVDAFPVHPVPPQLD